MAAFTRRLYALILNICTHMAYRQQILLAIALLYLVGLWLVVGMAHLLLSAFMHHTDFLPYPLNYHDPWD